MEPSKKMTRFIPELERTLGIKFEGDKKSFKDVKEFIDSNIGKWKEAKSSSPVSEKQQKGIDLITSTLGYQFGGATSGEASEFLDMYLKEALAELNKKEKKNHG